MGGRTTLSQTDNETQKKKMQSGVEGLREGPERAWKKKSKMVSMVLKKKPERGDERGEFRL